VDHIYNKIFVDNAFLSVDTPHLSTAIELSIPDQDGVGENVIGFEVPCGDASSCDYERVGSRIASENFLHVTNPLVLEDFIGSGTISADFAAEVWGLADGLCHETHWCPPVPGTSCFYPSHACSDYAFVSSWIFSYWNLYARVTYRYEPATVGGFVCAAPVAEANGPYVAFVGDPINFSAIGTQGWEPPDCPLLYEWDWENDGTADDWTTSREISHTYGSEFSGTLRLTVTSIGGDLRSVDVDTAVVEVAAIPGDFDIDSDVDRDDMDILLIDRNKSVGDSACGSACDLDGDGFITGLDLRMLVLLCTRDRCATE
jgi:hypothetical protein